jgi:serine phosphatase RsbU (regulator of sigma subunit)
VMAQLRTAAHILADLGLPPGQILSKLDQMVATMATAQFATCVYAVTDPAASTCVIAQAGHLPPMLIYPGGETELLNLPPGLPVGLGAEAAVATEISLPPGATLALFTDGLVEGRSRSLDEGLDVLQAALGKALADPAIPLAAAAEAVIRQLCERTEDDVTLVLSRIRGNG